MAEHGHPYVWVQNLGGLQFPSDTPQVCVFGFCSPRGVVTMLICAPQLHVLVVTLLCVCVCQSARAGSCLSASHMETTMKLLRGRVQSRLALHKQFSSLGEYTHTYKYHTHAGLTPLLVAQTDTTHICTHTAHTHTYTHTR